MDRPPVPGFFNKIKRVCLLDAGVYDDTRHSFFSAALIVFFVAISHGIGGFLRAKINNWNTIESLVFGLQGEIVFWLVQSVFYILVAKWILKKQVKAVEILSAVGYAIFPGILVLFAAFGQLVSFAFPILVILAAYRLATCTIALRQLLKLSWVTTFILVLVGTATGILSLGLVIRFTESWLK